MTYTEHANITERRDNFHMDVVHNLTSTTLLRAWVLSGYCSCTLLSTLSHTCKYILSTSYIGNIPFCILESHRRTIWQYRSAFRHWKTCRRHYIVLSGCELLGCSVRLAKSDVVFKSRTLDYMTPSCDSKKKLRKHIQLHIGAYPFFAVFVMMCITFTGYWASGDVTFGRPRSSVLTLRSLSSTLVRNSCLFSWAVWTQTKCNQAVLTLVQHRRTENYTVLMYLRLSHRFVYSNNVAQKHSLIGDLQIYGKYRTGAVVFLGKDSSELMMVPQTTYLRLHGW